MNNRSSHRSKFWLYAFLSLVLLTCLWAGWRDFDPWLSQDEIREDIRSTIRFAIRFLVQFLVPAAILFYFGTEAAARLRGKRRKSGSAD
jgi:hypothetical protein